MTQPTTQKQALFDAIEGIDSTYITSAIRREDRHDRKNRHNMSTWITVAACLAVGVGVWLALLLGGALGPGVIPGGKDTETGTAAVSEPVTPEESTQKFTDTSEDPESEAITESDTTAESETTAVSETTAESKTATETEAKHETETETETEADPDIVASGVLASCTWSLHVNGTLTIAAADPNTATAIPDCKDPGKAPWYPYRTQIKAVTVEAPLTAVGKYAFYGLEALQDTHAVSLPDTMSHIGDGAFWSCGFVSLDLSGWNYTYDDFVFQECTSVTEVIFPSGMTTLPPKMLNGCSALETLTIPSTVKEIGEFALQGLSIKTLILEDGGVESIGPYACHRLYSLERVYLGDSLVSIGSNAFAECRALREVVLPESLTGIGYGAFSSTGIGPSLTIQASCTDIEGAFDNCSNLKELIVHGTYDTLPSIRSSSLEVLSFPDVTREVAIPVQGFHACTALRTITLGEGGVITKVGREGFYLCGKLKEIPLGALTYVGERAFTYCKELNPTVLRLCGEVGNDAFSENISLSHVLIDTGSQLGNSVFENCTGLERLWFADGVRLGTKCFSGCPGTMELYFPGETARTFDLTFAPVTHTGCSRDNFLAMHLS